MKKILILGGTRNQLPLIKAAKDEGYHVVVCDWTNDNPGLRYCDKHYQVSTLDREAVLKVATEEKIDGIISNSEPAMENVAYVANQLGLVGNPVSGIKILTSKDGFRTLQERIGLYAPKHIVTSSKEEFYEIVPQVGFPLVVKPVECTGTRGTTKFTEMDTDLLGKVFDECMAFSQNGKVSVEEYVEMPSLTILDGDVFVMDGDIIWDGMFFSTRSSVAPMVPMTQSFPMKLEDGQMETVKRSLTKIFHAAGIVHGEYNVEMYFNKNGELFIIEINARQGGNGIPKMIYEHCGIDMYKLLVTTTVGDRYYYNEIMKEKRRYHCVSRFPVFSRESGLYKSLHIDESLRDHVIDVEERKQVGSAVNKVKNATDVVAFVSLRFDSYEQQHHFVDRLETLIYPVLM